MGVVGSVVALRTIMFCRLNQSRSNVRKTQISLVDANVELPVTGLFIDLSRIVFPLLRLICKFCSEHTMISDCESGVSCGRRQYLRMCRQFVIDTPIAQWHSFTNRWFSFTRNDAKAFHPSSKLSLYV